MQERFVFGLRFRGEVQKTKKVAVGRMVLGADIVDELLPIPNSAINPFKVNLTRKILCGNYFGNLPLFLQSTEMIDT